MLWKSVESGVVVSNGNRDAKLPCCEMLSMSEIHGYAQARQRKRDRWVFGGVIGVCSLLAISTYLFVYGATYLACWNYHPQEGDLIFQSIPLSPLVKAIEGATESPFSHCGIVTRQDGRWVVIEAYHGVETTPLREFIFRGRQQGFAVYRLNDNWQLKIPAMIQMAMQFLGRPYDVRYRWDDEKIYCSELIYKAFRDATDGEQLGIMVRFGDLNWRPYESTVRHFEGGPVPVEREMITPRDLAKADQLQLVFSHRISHP